MLWVPAAYRRPPRVSNGNIRPNRVTMKETYSNSFAKSRPKIESNVMESLMRNARRDTKREQSIIKAKEKKLLFMLKDLIRLSSEYRKFFSSDSDHYDSIFDENSNILLPSIVDSVTFSMKDLHRNDSPLEWSQIEASENHYRSICRALQSIVMMSAAITRHKQYYFNALMSSSPMENESTNFLSEYVNLTELGVTLLVELGKERKIFVESSRRWISQIQNQVIAPKPPSVEEDAAPRQQPATLKGWIKSIVDRFPRNSDSAINSRVSVDKNDEITATRMAHEEPDLHVNQKMLRTAVVSIASSLRVAAPKTISFHSSFKYNSNPTSQGKELDDLIVPMKSIPKTTKLYQNGADRMIDLIERLPLDLIPDPVSQKIVMETLCRCGTLQSARQCSKIFDRHPSNQYHLRFSLVLQAYLEGIKHETCFETRMILIDEALDILDKHWSKSLRCHRLERIIHGSIVLHCMALANVGGVPDMCEKAELVAKRSLGGLIYKQLKNEMQSSTPRTDAQTFPLVNYLAQIYASSGESSKIEQAKQMLMYMMHFDREGTGRLIVYPEIHTINSIIHQIVCRYEGISRNRIEINSSVEDLLYATNLLDYMLNDPASSCWPNNDTFNMLFRLIFAIDPKDFGERTENLLAKIEMARYFARPKSDISVSLSTYHRVFGGLLQRAKKAGFEDDEASSIDCCYRALRLLEQLDAQTIPLFLSDRSMQTASIKLYDASLRPTRRTYKLVLQICSEAAAVTSKTTQEEIVALALNTYQVMTIKREFSPGKDASLLLTQLHSLLSEESHWKREIDTLLDDAKVIHISDRTKQSQ